MPSNDESASRTVYNRSHDFVLLAGVGLGLVAGGFGFDLMGEAGLATLGMVIMVSGMLGWSVVVRRIHNA